MSGWLSKEVLDALEHAGYVAVPKERIKEFWAEEYADLYEAARLDPEFRSQFNEGRMRRIAHTLGMELLRAGFIDIQLDMPTDHMALKHRAHINVLAPRTVK